DLGVRTDPEARALRRASQLYNAGKAKQAGEIFGRYDSLDAEVGAALADWPAGTVERLRTLAATHPHSSLAALNLGVALYWSRQDAAALVAWRAAARLQPDTQFAAAVREAPNDPDARVAAAVGLFDKADPSRAFSRLGPLVRVFPHAQTVRFHLGVLLLWIDELDQARKELQQAHDEDPGSPLGKQA